MFVQLGKWHLSASSGLWVKRYTVSTIARGLAQCVSDLAKRLAQRTTQRGELKQFPRSMAGGSNHAMHKSEQDFIFNWMNTLRRMRGTGEASRGRVVRCRKLESAEGKSETGLSTKRVHFVRHGEGHHNVHSTVWFDAGKGGNPWEHPTCPVDPTLTDLGVDQANDLNRRGPLEIEIKPELVVVSPLMRTLQTATLGFAWLIAEQVPFLAQEDCREIMGQHRCESEPHPSLSLPLILSSRILTLHSFGSPFSASGDRRVRSIFRKKAFSHVDFSMLEDFEQGAGAKPSEDDLEAMADAVFNVHGPIRETDQDAVKRALDFLFWLKERPESDIVVVTHSAWLCVAFNGAMHCDCEDLQSWFNTGEIRSTTLEFEEQAK